jgi:hypothetical protein
LIISVALRAAGAITADKYQTRIRCLRSSDSGTESSSGRECRCRCR